VARETTNQFGMALLVAERIGDLFSQGTYVRTYVVGHAQECHAECRYIPQAGPIGTGHMCVTQSDTLRYARLR